MRFKHFMILSTSVAAMTAAQADEGFFKNHVFVGADIGASLMSTTADMENHTLFDYLATKTFKKTAVAGGVHIGYRCNEKPYFFFGRVGYTLNNDAKKLTPTMTTSNGVHNLPAAYVPTFDFRRQYTVMGAFGFGYGFENGISVAALVKGLYSGFKVNYTDKREAGLGGPIDAQKNMAGMGAGVGIEVGYHINDKLTGTLEYTYEAYEKKNFTKVFHDADTTIKFSAKPRFHTVMVGLRYKLG